MFTRKALVQGASRGIGLEFTKQLLHRNTPHVFAACRDPKGSKGLQALVDQFPGRLTLVPLDVSRESSIQSAAESIKDNTDKLGFLIMCLEFCILTNIKELQSEK